MRVPHSLKEGSNVREEGKPMRILDARVRWNDKVGNEPELEILVDRIPSMQEFIHQRYILNKGSATLYLGYLGDVAHFFVSTKDKEGFAGRTFTINVFDDDTGEIKQEKVKGPWTSRTGVVNTVVEDSKHCTEVVAYEGSWNITGTPIAIRASVARRVTEKFADAELRKELKFKGEVYYTPRRKVPYWRYEMPRADRVMLQAAEVLNKDAASIFYEEGEEEIPNDIRSLLTNIKQYLEKYYGPNWKERLNYSREKGMSSL